MHFPKPLQIPEEVSEARAERKYDVIRALLIGVGVRSIVILAELLGAYFYGSSTLLLDGLSSVVDVVSSFILLFCIAQAARPPDKNHPFGHGRFEPLAGLQLGLILALVGAGMFVQQIMNLISSENIHRVIDSRTWIISFGAFIFLEGCYYILMRVVKKNRSPALYAEAIHYRTDAWNSLFATFALGLAAMLPHWSLLIDRFGALILAGVMVWLGIKAIRSNVHQLVDHIPEDHYFTRVKNAAISVEGVLDTEKIRIQLYGPDAHVDIDIEVQPDLSVEVAHEISQHVRRAIQKEWPAVRDVTVHIEPFYPNDH